MCPPSAARPNLSAVSLPYLCRHSDTNHNGHLTLMEVDNGLRLVFGREGPAVSALSPAIMRAFHAAKDVKKGKQKGAPEDEAVSRSEFRLLLVYLKRYFELLEMFDAVDTSDDRRIDHKVSTRHAGPRMGGG